MGDVVKAVRVILGVFEDLDQAERGRVMGILLALQGEDQSRPAAKEREPAPPRKSAAADPKDSGTTRSEHSSGKVARREAGSCPDHRDRILQLLAKGPMRASELMQKLGIRQPEGIASANVWEWRVNITALQQAGKVKCERKGALSLWSLA